jgi:hypothetical protein
MTVRRMSRAVVMLSSLAALGWSLAAHAVERTDLKGLEGIFGRYAPAGDCKRQPQILVDVSGITFFVAGQQEKVTNPEQALVSGSPYAKCT